MTDPTVIPTETLKTGPSRGTVQRVSARLDGFAHDLGLTKATAWTIVETVVADLPDRDDEDLAMEARKRMLKAAL